MARTDLLQRLGIEHPIFQAPTSGGPSTPALAAAVSEAGGLGSLANAYSTPAQIAEESQLVRARTNKPFGMNLFAGAYDATASGDAAPMLALLESVHEALDLPPPVLPKLPPDPFPAQFEAVLAARPAVFSFTFGMVDAPRIAQLKAANIFIVGTATTVEEGRALEASGVDAILAQGKEAGGHRGTFARAVEESLVPALELTEALARTVQLPIIAAGGLMDGRDIAEALRRGAAAAALGTAFLATAESGASDAYKQALLSVKEDHTMLTRAFSGRWARGLENEFTRRLSGKEATILPYPLQNALTRPMRNAAGKQGQADFLSLWAGQGVTRIRARPAGELVRLLVEELRAAQA